MSDREPVERRSPFSALGSPAWLNPTSIKGTIAIGVGLFVLTVPGVSVVLLHIVIGGALILSGLSVGWFGIRAAKGAVRRRALPEGGLSVVTGLLFLFYPTRTETLLVRLAAAYFGLRALLAFREAFPVRREPKWRLHLVRGGVSLMLAIVMILLPAGIAAGLRFLGAAVAVVVGVVMVGYGVSHHDDAEAATLNTASMFQVVNGWLATRDLGDARREEIADSLYFEPPERASKLVAWWMMLVLSVAIATFAILGDSTAVVIGAMLIAPLMTPILGVAGAIVNGWTGRLVTSLALVAAGVAVAIGLAYIIGTWAPALVPLSANGQVTSRTSPNLLDMAVAIAAGAAGAFAMVDKRVSDSIAGVAIAVALVPPLGVVGLTFQAGMTADAWGAFLLFFTNLVSIILAATLVFFLTGFAPIHRWHENREQIMAALGTVLAAALVILIPLAFTAQTILASASAQSTATRVVQDWLGDTTELQLVDVSADLDEIRVVVTGQGEPPPIADLDAALDAGFGRDVDVRVEVIPSTIYRSGE